MKMIKQVGENKKSVFFCDGGLHSVYIIEFDIIVFLKYCKASSCCLFVGLCVTIQSVLEYVILTVLQTGFNFSKQI